MPFLCQSCSSFPCTSECSSILVTEILRFFAFCVKSLAHWWNVSINSSELLLSRVCHSSTIFFLILNCTMESPTLFFVIVFLSLAFNFAYFFLLVIFLAFFLKDHLCYFLILKVSIWRKKERKKEYNEREKHTTRFMIFNWCDPLLLAKPSNPYPT